MLFMNCSSLFCQGLPFLTQCDFFQVQGCMFLCAWSCAASLSLWMPSLIMTYDYDTLIAPSPIKKKKKYLATCDLFCGGMWDLISFDQGLNLGGHPAPSRQSFCPWNLEPDIQIFSQIFRNLDSSDVLIQHTIWLFLKASSMFFLHSPDVTSPLTFLLFRRF